MGNKSQLSKQKQRPMTQFQGLMAKTGLTLRSDIEPLTDNQAHAFKIHHTTPQHLTLSGFPGTGKTFLALYFAFLDVMDRNTPVSQVVVVRPPVSSNDQGFLPGTAEDKMEPYIHPYIDICTTLFQRGDAFGVLKKHGLLKIESTSYLRGRTFDDTVLVFDEIQNGNFHELDTFITRAGRDTRLYLAGDYYQSDLSAKDRSGILEFLNILNDVPQFERIQFDVNDCVRSDLVLSYLKAKMRRTSKTFAAQETAEKAAA